MMTNSLSLRSVSSPRDNAPHSDSVTVRGISTNRANDRIAGQLFQSFAEDDQILQVTRFFQNLVFNCSQLSPDDVRGAGLPHAVECSNDFEECADSLRSFGEQLVKSSQVKPR